MATNGDELVLYDLLSKSPNQCWSPSTWKTRLILNYKGIRYRTEWIEYADVEATLKPLISTTPAPDQSGRVKYTVPAITFAEGKTLMDSAAIACELERRFPTAPGVAGIPPTSDVEAGAVSEDAQSDPALAELAEFATPHARLAKAVGRTLAVGIIENVVTDATRPIKIAEIGGEEPLERIKAGIDIPKLLIELEQPLRGMSEFWARKGGAFTPEGNLRWVAVRQLASLHYVKKGVPAVFNFIVEAEAAEALGNLYKEAEKKGWFDRNDH